MNARQRRQNGLEAHDLVAGQRAMERPGRAKDRIAFRHLGLRAEWVRLDAGSLSEMGARRICSPIADG